MKPNINFFRQINYTEVNNQLITDNNALDEGQQAQIDSLLGTDIANASKLLYYDVDGVLQKNKLINDLILNNTIQNEKIIGLPNLITQSDDNKQRIDNIYNTGGVNSLVSPNDVLVYDASGNIAFQKINGLHVGSINYDRIMNAVSQIDLQTEWNALQTQLASLGGNEIADIVGLQDELDSKSTNGHSHLISDVASLQTELNNRPVKGSPQTLNSYIQWTFGNNYYYLYSITSHLMQLYNSTSSSYFYKIYQNSSYPMLYMYYNYFITYADNLLFYSLTSPTLYFNFNPSTAIFSHSSSTANQNFGSDHIFFTRQSSNYKIQLYPAQPCMDFYYDTIRLTRITALYSSSSGSIILDNYQTTSSYIVQFRYNNVVQSYITSTGSLYDPSDKRRKKDICQINGSCYNDIFNDLVEQFCAFKINTVENTKSQCGIIIQDFMKLIEKHNITELDACINYDKDFDSYFMNYDQFQNYCLFIYGKKIQCLQKQIDKLKDTPSSKQTINSMVEDTKCPLTFQEDQGIIFEQLYNEQNNQQVQIDTLTDTINQVQQILQTTQDDFQTMQTNNKTRDSKLDQIYNQVYVTNSDQFLQIQDQINALTENLTKVQSTQKNISTNQFSIQTSINSIKNNQLTMQNDILKLKQLVTNLQ